jgi:hypothetical protein
MEVAVPATFIAAKDDAGDVAVGLFMKEAVSPGAAQIAEAEFGAEIDADWEIRNSLPDA